ncbi:MAG: PIN domain-containing protein, partial [Ectothiorhodospiraceae bacterium]
MTSPSPASRVFVLDTSVLMHDPAALFRFQEHDVYLPMAVLRELDTAKKGVSEEARNVRQASRFIDDLLGDGGPEALRAGLPLGAQREGPVAGRLYFLTDDRGGAGTAGDDAILDAAVNLQRQHPERQVTVVSKDVNLRIQATVLGVAAEDYHSDQVLDDVDLLYTGVRQFADAAAEELEDGTFRLAGDETWYPNEGVHSIDGRIEGLITEVHPDGSALCRRVEDFRANGSEVWGIHARNREQNFALNLLTDPAIDFITLLGPAGTGKTLLALAAGLLQTLEHGRYREIIMTRA